MGFSTKQVQALRRNLDHRSIRKREAGGRELLYIEGWHAISEANRIFGFDAWNRETVESKCVMARDNRGSFVAIYIAKVRITVQVTDATVIREGHGTGEGRSSSPAEAHEFGLKVAETDATKRALATFGRPFGLTLYRNGRTATSSKRQAPKSTSLERDNAPTKLPPDGTTPNPRPSHYYGRRLDAITRERTQARHQLKAASSTSIAPALPDASREKIDKSVLTIAEPKRIRDKKHLRFVGSHPCLVCGKKPSDAHHLRFAQP